MIARFHYDRNVYSSFLNDELPDDEEQAVQTHLENCDDCQIALESVSREQVNWNEIPRLLTRDVTSETDVDVPTSGIHFLTESDAADSLGRFGRFEIVEYLGSGGMGIVLKGYDPALNRYSAIKVLSPILATSASARKRFAREAKSAAAVVHEHVVPIQTVDEENGLPYFVMPVVDGKSLQQRVDENGPLQTKEILRIGMQIASGLAAAHAQGLVHRDVKPANVLLENGVERVMLTDFGLARAADDANMTQSGVITGTPQYMSPEQAQGLDVDHQSDLFSLGSVLYFMCTGHSPFRAKTTFGTINRIVNDKHRPVRHANTDVPGWLQQIIDRLLAKDRSDRFESATEVADLLSGWLAHLQQPNLVGQPDLPKPVKRKVSLKGVGKGGGYWRSIAAGFGGFLLLLGGLFVSMEMDKGTLTIECVDDEVQVRVMRGDTLVKKMLINRGAKSTRISAGNYVVEIDGPSDRLEIKNGEFVLSRGGAAIAKIVERPPLAPPERTEVQNQLDDQFGDLLKYSLAAEKNEIELVNQKQAAELQVEIAEAQYRSAKATSENSLQIESAKVEYDAAQADYEASLAANEATPGVVSQGELRSQKTTSEQAHIRVQQALKNYKQARLDALVKFKELQLAKSKLNAKNNHKDAGLSTLPGRTFVFTTADWCVSCKVMEQIIDELIAVGHPIKKVDATTVEEGDGKTKVPNFEVFQNGKKLAEWHRPLSKAEILRAVVGKSKSDVYRNEKSEFK